MVKLLYHIFVRISSFFGSYHFNTYKVATNFKIVTIINRTDNIPLTSEVKGVALNGVSQRRAARGAVAQLRRINSIKLQLEEFLW